MTHEMFWRYGGLLALFTLAACSDGGDGPMDASAPSDARIDAGTYDAGTRYDGGVAIDGSSDSGFSDPNTVLIGSEEVNLGQTYLHVRGTVTSTLPPILILPTGPQQGGISGFFGHFGGGIGHEYLPPTMDFLLPGRLMIYYDYQATGRSGFGSIGSSTISVESHVLQVPEVLDWVGERIQVDTTRVDIVGHGYGAGIGMLFSVEHPERVGRLVMIDPMALTVGQYAQAIADLQARLTTSDRQKLDQLTREPDCIGNPSVCTVEVWKVLATRLGCAGNEGQVNTLSFMYGELRTFDFIRRDLTEERYDWTPLLPSVQAETTVISGPCDPTNPHSAATYTASIAGAVHEILPDTGHWPMVEDPALFQRTMKRLLQYP